MENGGWKTCFEIVDMRVGRLWGEGRIFFEVVLGGRACAFKWGGLWGVMSDADVDEVGERAWRRMFGLDMLRAVPELRAHWWR